MPIIDVSHLTKTFKVYEKEAGLAGSVKSLFKRNTTLVQAVKDVSFSIAEGELVGFIGPNGAGKTTTLKCLSGLLYPDSGTVSVLGYVPFQREHEYLKQISLVMGQKNQLWWDLPALESFLLYKDIYEIPEKTYRRTLNLLVEMLDVGKVLHIQVRKLSLGERMKCELIGALIHSPKVLFMDEPTIGLDVVMQKKIREFIKQYNREFTATIVLTSHYMEDVKQLSKRVIVINQGRIVFDGELEAIVKKYADYKTVKVVVAGSGELKKVPEHARVLHSDNGRIELAVTRDHIASVTSAILHNHAIDDFTIEEPAIEEVISQIYAEK